MKRGKMTGFDSSNVWINSVPLSQSSIVYLWKISTTKEFKITMILCKLLYEKCSSYILKISKTSLTCISDLKTISFNLYANLCLQVIWALINASYLRKLSHLEQKYLNLDENLCGQVTWTHWVRSRESFSWKICICICR